MTELSLVIPVYNEENHIDNLLRSCSEYFDRTGRSYELILVDDGSTDASAEKIRGCLSEKIRMVTLNKNTGKGAAVRAGILAARGESVFFTDSDLAYGLEVLPGMTALLKEGADLVLGSRALAEDGYGDYPLLRRVASYLFSWITTVFSGVTCDSQCGIKGFRRESALKLFKNLHTEGYAFDLEVILLAEKEGMRLAEYPVTIINQGDSRINVLTSSVSMLWDMVCIRRRVRKMTERSEEK